MQYLAISALLFLLAPGLLAQEKPATPQADSGTVVIRPAGNPTYGGFFTFREGPTTPEIRVYAGPIPPPGQIGRLKLILRQPFPLSFKRLPAPGIQRLRVLQPAAIEQLLPETGGVLR